MDNNVGFTSDQILKAVEGVKKIKPAYDSILQLYEKIFLAQADSENHIHLNDIDIPQNTLDIKVKEKLPLIEISQFSFDAEAAKKLFVKLCDIFLELSDDKHKPVKALKEAVLDKKLNSTVLFSAFLANDEEFFNKVSVDFNIDKELLGLVVYNSINPSLVSFARRISRHLSKEEEWGKGYCPVCGSPPAISTFEENGKRFFFCGFCWHKWAAKRIFCPFCENTDHESLRYFYAENEEVYRVDACDRCNKYIKTIDTRKTDRLIYPPLEYLATAHIDIRIKEMGIESGFEAS